MNNGSISKKRGICLVLLIAWMIFIFSMSSMNSDDSAGLSGEITRTVVRITTPDFDTLSPERQTEVWANTETAVRKTAHAAEYLILGILAMLLLSTFRRKAQIQVVLAILLCVAYAATDEFHQLFSAGRSCQATDVLIDTAGAAAGVLATAGILKIRKGKKSAAGV